MSVAGPGIGVIGLGFMGATHLASWARAAAEGHDNRLVAVCDGDPARLAGTRGVGPGGRTRVEFERRSVALYGDAQALLADPAVDIVSITTPTDSHVPLALEALARGKHVLVEKPVALDPAAIASLQRAAATSATLCMPAHCMRFWPGWDWLIARVDDGRLGELRELHIQRLSARPDWGDGFYGDPTRCGGVVHDLHVHDADLILRLLGCPRAVTVERLGGGLTVDYQLPARGDGSAPPRVTAEASWERDPSLPFFMGYEARFEGGRASWASDRARPLRWEIEGSESIPTLASGTGYDGQLRHLLAVISGRQATLAVTLDDALACARVLAAVSEALAGQGTVTL